MRPIDERHSWACENCGSVHVELLPSRRPIVCDNCVTESQHGKTKSHRVAASRGGREEDTTFRDD